MQAPPDRDAFVVCSRIRVLLLASGLSALVLAACSTRTANNVQPNRSAADRPPVPQALAPQSAFETDPAQPSGRQDVARQRRIIDLTDEGAVSWGTAPVEIIDTRLFKPQIQAGLDWDGQSRLVKEVLPPHKRHAPPPEGPRNDLPVGGVMDVVRTAPGPQFPGIDLGGSGGWIPPDPTLAVGPEHIVTTVNMAIAFYAKDGTLEFSALLNSAGNPGFFETVGAGWFTFDPKCYYDQYDQRFVVIAPEVYFDEQTAWLCIAVSDDNDPHGIWYKYRTDCVITVGNNTYWLDYPGLGFDQDAIYVTGNLFGLNEGGWGGVLFRTFDKAPLLVGQPASYVDLRDENAASVQVAQHFGTPAAPYFVSVASTSSLKIHAILDPLTNPTLVHTRVTVPYFAYPTGGAPNVGGVLNIVDQRIFNVHWRDGNLYAAHTIHAGGKNFARWDHLLTNDWPYGGEVTWVQSGKVGGGEEVHTFFPAVYSNKYHGVGLVLGSCSPSTTPAVQITGRNADDPEGEMGALTPIKIGSHGADGRWGDYFGIATDPVNDALFWVIGEYQNAAGWATWISSFSVITCEGDFDRDRVIGLSDLALLLGNYGMASGATYEEGDLSGDGAVDLVDLSILLSVYMTTCE